MKALFLLLVAGLLAAVGLAAPVRLTVNAKAGDTVSGETTFRVTVQAENPVTQVEFYVNGELRENDTSTPYEFKLDTIALDDGNLTVRFVGYTSEGETGQTEFAVKVDNGVAKGADFHVQRGRDLLTESKWDEAITAGRVALKADPNSNPARLVMAQAYYRKGVLDLAQKFAEDAVNADGKNAEALDLLAGINLQRAFRTVTREGMRAEDARATIATALRTAVESRRKVLDQRVESFGEITDANRLAYADLTIRAQRYTLATNALATAFRDKPGDAALANRLAYALMRLGRNADAAETLALLKKNNGMDAASYAILAVLEAAASNRTASEAALKEAILNDSQNLSVRTAQAFLALRSADIDATPAERQASRNAFNQLANQLQQDQGARVETNYFLSLMSNRLARFEDARRFFERAVLTEPTNTDMFLAQGHESLFLAFSGNLPGSDAGTLQATAAVFFETALVARPDSAEALCGLAVVNMLQNKPADAVRFARAAVAAAPAYAGASYTLAGALQLQLQAFLRLAQENRTNANRLGTDASEEAARLRSEADRFDRQASDLLRETQTLLQTAGRLDRANLQGRSVPDARSIWRYLTTGGRLPMIAPPQ